jgi:hypothetical protein
MKRDGEREFEDGEVCGIRKPLKYFIDLWMIENVIIGVHAFEAAPIKVRFVGSSGYIHTDTWTRLQTESGTWHARPLYRYCTKYFFLIVAHTLRKVDTFRPKTKNGAKS